MDYSLLLDLVSSILLLVIIVHVVLYQVLYYIGRGKSTAVSLQVSKSCSSEPLVTIQVPLRNEPEDLVEEMLRSLMNLDWPRDRLEVIFVDDSEIEHSARLSKVFNRYSNCLNLKVLRRSSRNGFKAGALNLAMKHASGKYIAVFDVDTTPLPHFLRLTIPFLELGNYDYVQVGAKLRARDCSLIARACEAFEDLKFSVAHYLSCFGVPLFGFGLVIRSDVLRAIGGWNEREGSLAEDYDLMIRGAIAGLKGVYVSEKLCWGEVPHTYHSFVTQNERWFLGRFLVTLYHIRDLVRARINVMTKLALFIQGVAYIPLTVLSLFPLLAILAFVFGVNSMNLTAIMLLTLFITCTLQLVDTLRSKPRITYEGTSVCDVARAILLYISLSPHLLIALIKYLVSRRLEFKVTPKGSRRYVPVTTTEFILEVVALMYSALGLVLSILRALPLVPFCLLLTTSLLYILFKFSLPELRERIKLMKWEKS